MVNCVNEPQQITIGVRAIVVRPSSRIRRNRFPIGTARYKSRELVVNVIRIDPALSVTCETRARADVRLARKRRSKRSGRMWKKQKYRNRNN